MTHPPASRVLYLIAYGAGPAADVDRLIHAAQAWGWDVHLIATPAALDFLDLPTLENQTGHPVHSSYRPAGQTRTRSLPHADTIIVALATYNTINKWAHGTSDTYALGILAEAAGFGILTVVLPFVNTALAAHPAFARSVGELRAAGIHILLGPGQWRSHLPGTGEHHRTDYPWERALDEAERLT